MPTLSREEMEELDSTSRRPSNPLQNLKRALLEGFCAPRHTPPRSDQPVIHVGPFDSLKRVLHGFCDQPVTTSREPCDTSLVVTRSWDSGDSALTKESRNSIASDNEQEEEEVVAVTRPGTRRIVRVIMGLETFLSAVSLLVFTCYLLHRLGMNLGLELSTIDGSQCGAFFSISPRN